VALQKVVLDAQGREVWEYYDAGPKDSTAVVFLPPTPGTADCFFLQALALSAKGYRVVTCTPSSIYRTAPDFVRGFNRFLEAANVGECHLVGAGLGCFLGLSYIQIKPKRIKSFIAINGFVDNQFFIQKNIYFGAFTMVPTFLLEKVVLSSFPTGPLEARTLRSVDFMVDQVSKRLRGRDLVSRLSLLNAASLINPEELELEDKNITLIDTLDDPSRPENVKEELYKFFPGAHQAMLKSGGEFPYLSRSSDLNVHLQVHLRRFLSVEYPSSSVEVPPEVLPLEISSDSLAIPVAASSSSS
jgi:maspardin